MTVASSNFTTLSYCPESTYGELPTAKAFQFLPVTGESLQYTKDSITSNTIESSRQITDQVQTGFQVGGGTEFELAPKQYDELMEGAMWQAWGTATSIEGTETITLVATTKTITASVGTPFSDVVAGQFIYISGMDESNNDGVWQIATVTSSTVIVVIDEDGNLTDTTGDNTNVTIRASMMRNGTTDLSYYFEKCITDLNPDEYFDYSGCKVNSFSVSAQSSSIITGSFDFLGKTSLEYDTTSKSTGAVEAAASTAILNAVADVGGIRIDGATQSSVYFQGLDFSLGNNLRGVQAIANLGNVAVSPGQFSVTGSLNAYFSDKTMYALFLADTEFSLSYSVVDSSTNQGYNFYFPRVVVSSSSMSASGKDQDLVETISWTALKSASTATVPNCTVQIDRFLADYTDAPDQN